MHNILFQGKRADNGEWVEGNYIHQTEYYGDEIDQHWIMIKGNFDYDSYNAYQVIPETVRQYIGKNDKNDKKIFEGDILGNAADEIGVVRYEDEDGAFCWLSDNICFYFTHIDSKHYEVIGNIYDNPELLEVQND